MIEPIEINEHKRTEFLEKLESLHKVLLSIKVLYECTVPKSDYKINDRYFYFLYFETIKLVLGRLSILLNDPKDNNFNNMSFQILTNEIGKEYKKSNQQLKTVSKMLSKIDRKYVYFRNKVFAHVELKDDHSAMINRGLSN